MNMEEYNLIQLQPIIRDEFLPLPSFIFKQSEKHTSMQQNWHMPLENLKDIVGVQYVPQYLPDRYELKESIAWGEDGKGISRLLYMKPGKLGTRITVDSFSNSGHPMVKEGNYHKIFINLYPGYYIDGQWAVRGHSGSVDNITWEVGRVQGVMFELDTQWIWVKITNSAPSKSNHKNELIRIAESMTPF